MFGMSHHRTSPFLLQAPLKKPLDNAQHTVVIGGYTHSCSVPVIVEYDSVACMLPLLEWEKVAVHAMPAQIVVFSAGSKILLGSMMYFCVMPDSGICIR